MIASADLTVSGVGDITINETNALTLTDVDTSDGSITVTAGALTVWPLAIQYGAVAIPLPAGGGGVTGTGS